MEILRDWLKGERGRASALAKELKKSPSAISQWKNVPPEHVLVIERFSGISRHDLRPDLYGPAPAEPPQQDAAA